MGQRHIRIFLKRLFRNDEETLDEMEAIVKYVLLCRVKVTLSSEPMMKIVTDFNSVRVPKNMR